MVKSLYIFSFLQSQAPPKKPPRRNVSMSPVKIIDQALQSSKPPQHVLEGRKLAQVKKDITLFEFTVTAYLYNPLP